MVATRQHDWVQAGGATNIQREAFIVHLVTETLLHSVRRLQLCRLQRFSRFSMCGVHLNDSHAEAGLLGELLPDVTGGLRSLAEGSLEDLQLLGLDGGAGAASLAARLLGGPVLLLELVPVLGVPGVEAAALPLPELRLLGLDLGQQRPAAQTRVPGLQHAVVVGLNLSNIPTSILIV